MREQVISTYSPDSRILLSQRFELVTPIQLPEYPDLKSQLRIEAWDLRDQSADDKPIQEKEAITWCFGV